jgi:hypothetical protein
MDTQDAAGQPVLLTLPAPEPMSFAGGIWAFALAPTHARLARAAVDDATVHVIPAIAGG